ncbi:hypothetical protein B2J86_13780 [Acidovorax sp. SRB_14]|uniref:hypothetical protein n=1 Tax=Acidovorax sp. SRB_14 TaxID=1962699 RepID=UPI00146A1FB6|nr:hypothetical protein [Acidovorax sp. SRB_14]NMM81982.1 hypothetical protein [Acidovorax sp. SRB_14]
MLNPVQSPGVGARRATTPRRRHGTGGAREKKEKGEPQKNAMPVQPPDGAATARNTLRAVA